MRARNLKPAIYKNEVLARLGSDHFKLFTGLWGLADRKGRLENRPDRIEAEIFPFKFQTVDVPKMLIDLASGADPFIVLYEAKSRRYIQVITFERHANPHYKEPPSVIPSPPGHKDRKWIGGGVPESLRQEIIHAAGKCQACGGCDDLTVDHIKPRVLGGTNKKSNLQCLCRKCNSAKNNKLIKEIDSRVNVGPRLGLSSPLNPSYLNPEPLLPDIPAGGFEIVWSKYPRRLGRKAAEKHFNVSVKTKQDWLDIQNALDNYIRQIRKDRTEEQYVKHGSTWFNNWRDYVNYAGVTLPNVKETPKLYKENKPKPEDLPTAEEVTKMVAGLKRRDIPK